VSGGDEGVVVWCGDRKIFERSGMGTIRGRWKGMGGVDLACCCWCYGMMAVR
jgi:hypothetical protein